MITIATTTTVFCFGSTILRMMLLLLVHFLQGTFTLCDGTNAYGVGVSYKLVSSSMLGLLEGLFPPLEHQRDSGVAMLHQGVDERYAEAAFRDLCFGTGCGCRCFLTKKQVVLMILVVLILVMRLLILFLLQRMSKPSRRFSRIVAV
jgi:hypothetical protein